MWCSEFGPRLLRPWAYGQNFAGGGGLLSLARISKRPCNYVRKARRPSRPGRVQGPHKGPGSSGVLDAIWCNLSLLFEHFCTKFMTNISEIILVLSMGDESITFEDTLPFSP